jgi:hypothetical protein
MRRFLATIAAGLLFSSLLVAGRAAAGEVVTTAGASGQTPPQAAAPAAPLSVQPHRDAELGGQTLPLADPRCPMVPPDGKAHGEVWGGVGTSGYRDVGGAVTVPTGKCSSVSIAIDRAQGDFGWRR